MTKNAFNQQIPEIKTLFNDEKVEQRIRKTLRSVLTYLEIDSAEEVTESAIKEAKNYTVLSHYEKKVHQLFDKKRIIQGLPAKLVNRAKHMFNQMKEYIQGHQVLDLGCGDGKVGELIAKQGRHVMLADVYQHGNISNLDLSFVKIKQNREIPFDDNTFDTTLLLTVLHHCDDPHRVIQEANRVTKPNGRIIVIESVYGISEFGDGLSEEQQRMVTIFFDHFYNRVIHYSEFEENKVNVPFNFQTPDAWKTFFEKNGLVQETLVRLGFDQPTVPEYHTLHVLQVRK